MTIGVVYIYYIYYIDFQPIYLTFKVSFQLPFNGVQGNLLLMTSYCLGLLENMIFDSKDKQ